MVSADAPFLPERVQYPDEIRFSTDGECKAFNDSIMVGVAICSVSTCSRCSGGSLEGRIICHGKLPVRVLSFDVCSFQITFRGRSRTEIPTIVQYRSSARALLIHLGYHCLVPRPLRATLAKSFSKLWPSRRPIRIITLMK